MKNKNGFTLVEVLAVIAILAILVLFIVPNILDLYQNSKKSAFKTEIQGIYNNAINQYSASFLKDGGQSVSYCRVNGITCTGSEDLIMTGRTNLNFKIEINDKGQVLNFVASDGKYQYKNTSTITNVNDITDVESVADASEIVRIP